VVVIDGSWIYNYLCNQCLSKLKFVSDLRWVSLGIPVSSINKTYRHEITETLLKVVLNTITITLTLIHVHYSITSSEKRNDLTI
jgi:hypothetical protein